MCSSLDQIIFSSEEEVISSEFDKVAFLSLSFVASVVPLDSKVSGKKILSENKKEINSRSFSCRSYKMWFLD